VLQGTNDSDAVTVTMQQQQQQCKSNRNISKSNSTSNSKGKGWTTLRSHTNDDSLAQQGCCKLWDIEQAGEEQQKETGDGGDGGDGGEGKYFRYFRILSTGPDSGGLHYLMFGCLELYGQLVEDVD
jgi:hypothetical protein